MLSRDDVLRHTRRETRAWQADTAQNRIDLLTKQAALNHNDPASVAVYAGAAANAARSRAQATDGDAAALAGDAASSVWRSAIESALARDDLASAKTLHADARDALRPADASALAGQMATAQEHATGRAFANGQPLPETDPNGPLDLGPALTALDDAHQAATARNDAEWAHDPNQLATNRHFIDSRFGKAKRDVVKAKAELDHAVSTWLDQRDAEGNPQTERPLIATWMQMTPEMRQAVDQKLEQNALGDADRNIIPVSGPDEDEEKIEHPPGDAPIHNPLLPPDQSDPHHKIIEIVPSPLGSFPVPIRGIGPAPKAAPSAPPPPPAAPRPAPPATPTPPNQPPPTSSPATPAQGNQPRSGAAGPSSSRPAESGGARPPRSEPVLSAAEKEKLSREILERKLYDYLLDPTHPKGGPKAKWFESALGFTRENRADLAKQLVFDESKAVYRGTDKYGERFNQVIEIVGANGRKIPVLTAWMRESNGLVRFVTAIPEGK